MSEEKKELTGYIHSLESFGSVDGTGSTICDLCVRMCDALPVLP